MFTDPGATVLALAAAILYDKESSAIKSGSSSARRKSTNGTLNHYLNSKSL